MGTRQSACTGWAVLCALMKSYVVRTRLAGVDLDIGEGLPVARSAYCPRKPRDLRPGRIRLRLSVALVTSRDMVTTKKKPTRGKPSLGRQATGARRQTVAEKRWAELATTPFTPTYEESHDSAGRCILCGSDYWANASKGPTCEDPECIAEWKSLSDAQKRAYLAYVNGDLKVKKLFEGLSPWPSGFWGEPWKPASAALVVGDNVTSGRGAGFGDAKTNRLVEQAAITKVTRFLIRQGYTVRSRESEGIGYDLDASKNGKTLHVEVKGISGSKIQFPITTNEVQRAMTDSAFRLLAVTAARTRAARVHSFQRATFITGFELKPLSFMATKVRG